MASATAASRGPVRLLTVSASAAIEFVAWPHALRGWDGASASEGAAVLGHRATPKCTMRRSSASAAPTFCLTVQRDRFAVAGEAVSPSAGCPVGTAGSREYLLHRFIAELPSGVFGYACTFHGADFMAGTIHVDGLRPTSPQQCRTELIV